jgi:uncharacterized membrane protein YbhN (UPF0104 family)
VSRHLFKIAQWIFAVTVICLAIYELADQWTEVRGRLETLDIHWGAIFLASFVVLVVYALLIEAWRRTLAAWDTALGWRTAARIWFASSLGKYIPGYIWSLTALGVMAKKRGASAVAAAGSSIIVNVLTLASGLAVVLLCGSRLISHPIVAVLVLLVALVGVALAPILLPKLVEIACKVTGKEIPIPNISARVIWLVLLWTGIAWVGYGLAFWGFSYAMLGSENTAGSALLYIAVYTGGYILGLLTPIAPAGVGVREGVIIEGLPLFGVTSHADALILALTSRLWLTLLEVVPGLIALAVSQANIRTRHA